MRRHLAAVVAAVALASGLVAGCGIPDHTEVKTEERGPVQGSDTETSPPRVPKEREEATSKAEFVANFLEAAAGEFETSGPRLQKYLAPEAGKINIKAGVAVVQVMSIHWVDENKVTLTVRHLGLLNANGEILEPTETETETQYALEVGELEGGPPGFFVKKAPPQVILMNVEALASFYTERPVYFWNADHTALIPDLRWLPTDVSEGRVPTELLKMIERGPSPWLVGAAEPLPDGSKLIINAPQEGNQLTMNWSPQAVDNDSQDFLAQQVAWTLGRFPPAKLQLKINGQVRADYDTMPLQARLRYPIGPDIHAFAVLDGKIKALADSAGAIPSPLAGAADQNVRWAAFERSGDQLFGAVVSDKNKTLRLGSTTDGAIDALSVVPGIVATSPPTWIPGARIGLVTTDTGLYAFRPDGKSELVTLRGVTGPITSVAAAPEGQRIAVIADHNLFVVSLSVAQDGTLEFARARPLVAPLDALTAVAWSGETTLAVAGSGGESNRPAIIDVTVDGVRRFDRTLDAHAPVSMIVAYPENAVLGRTTSMVLYEADNQTWLARPAPTQIKRSDLAGETTPPSPSSDNPPPSEPTAPFYVY